MKANNLRYKIRKATEYEIFTHLIECSDAFIPPLAESVNIGEYAKKIYEKSVTFEAWDGKLLVGFIAAYFSDNADGLAFITNVSVLREFTGLGVASKMLDMCIEHAMRNNYKEVALEVHNNNNPAVRLYKSFGFEKIETKGDTLLMKRRI